MRHDFARSSARSCRIESIATLTFWLSIFVSEKAAATADHVRQAFSGSRASAESDGECCPERLSPRRSRRSAASRGAGPTKTIVAGGLRSNGCRAQVARAKDDRSSGDWRWRTSRSGQEFASSTSSLVSTALSITPGEKRANVLVIGDLPEPGAAAAAQHRWWRRWYGRRPGCDRSRLCFRPQAPAWRSA